jgi:hypothetical protein
MLQGGEADFATVVLKLPRLYLIESPLANTRDEFWQLNSKLLVQLSSAVGQVHRT